MLGKFPKSPNSTCWARFKPWQWLQNRVLISKKRKWQKDRQIQKWTRREERLLLAFSACVPCCSNCRAFSVFSFLLGSCQKGPFSLPKNPHPSALYLLSPVQAGIYLCLHLLIPLWTCWLRWLCTCLKENSPRKAQGRHLAAGTHIPAVCTAVFVALNGREGRLKRHLVSENFSWSRRNETEGQRFPSCFSGGQESFLFEFSSVGEEAFIVTAT